MHRRRRRDKVDIDGGGFDMEWNGIWSRPTLSMGFDREVLHGIGAALRGRVG